MPGVAPPKERERAILRSFADRVDPWDPGAHNNLAVLYFTKGMIDEAVASFTRALELDPRMTVAQRNLEIAYFTGGYYDQRVEELGARLAAAPADRFARWELGRTFLLLGDVTQALDAFGVLLRDDPDDVRVIRQVATAEAKCGDLEAAARWLHHALEVEPDNPSVLFQLGEVAYQRGLNEEARVALERSVALAPGDADALYLLGFVLGDQGRHEEAREATGRALRINPSLGRAHASLSLERFDARSWQHAREAREARGLTEAASGQQMAHYALGLAFRHKGYLAEAIKEYRSALERGEDATLVQQAMAEAHLLLGEMPAARALYDQLLAEQPENPRWWNERGVALHHAGEYDAALSSYERSLDANPRYAVAWNNLGVAAFQSGDAVRAAAALQESAAIDGSLLKAQLNLALVLARQGAHGAALKAYRHVLDSSPQHATAWNGVGLVLSQLKRFEDARNAFGRAIEAREGYAEAHYNLSFALTSLGDHDGALRETQRALALDPYYTEPRFELAIELDQGETPLAIAIEVSASARKETVDEFVFEERTLEALFDEINPAPAVAEAPTGRADDPYREARSLLARGDHEEALAAARSALFAGAPRAEGLILQGETYLARGAAGEALERFREARILSPDARGAVQGEARALSVLRRFEEAVPAAEWLARHAADDVPSLLLVAEVLHDAHQHDAAWDALHRAASFAPDRAEIHATIARLARSQGDLAAAEHGWREALKRDTTNHDYAIELSALLYERGEDREAESLLAQVCDDDPLRGDAVLALAKLRRTSGRAADTVESLAAFLAARPYDLEVLASLGESLFVLDRLPDARFAFERILRFDPSQVVALYFKGVLAAQRYDWDEAMRCWERVMALEPAGEYARRAARDARTATEWRRQLTQPVRAWEAA